MNTYQVHPAAELFPVMSHEDLWNLAEDIKKNGLLEPVVLYHGEVLDGRNRLKACEMAEVEPHYAEVNGDVASPTLYVLSKNLHRRHLTTSQRSAIAADVVPLLSEEAHNRQVLAGTSNLKNQSVTQLAPIGAKGKATELAAKELQVGSRGVERALAVKRDSPEQFEQVKRGEITLNAAAGEQEKRRKRLEGATPTFNPQNKRQFQLANKHKERMITGLSTITGLCRGLPELKLDWILSVCDEEERSTWIERAKELSSQLKTFSKKLEETTWQPQQS